MLETTNNARFTPGNHIFMRIRINDGAGGTNVANYLTVTDSIKVIGFSADTDPNYGTGIRAESMAASKTLLFFMITQPEQDAHYTEQALKQQV